MNLGLELSRWTARYVNRLPGVVFRYKIEDVYGAKSSFRHWRACWWSSNQVEDTEMRARIVDEKKGRLQTISVYIRQQFPGSKFRP